MCTALSQSNAPSHFYLGDAVLCPSDLPYISLRMTFLVTVMPIYFQKCFPQPPSSFVCNTGLTNANILESTEKVSKAGLGSDALVTISTTCF
jgi:hypothetical protein